MALVVKNLPANAGDVRDVASIPRLGRPPGGGHGNPLQSSCLENPVDRGALRATVHSVTKGQTRLKQLSMQTHILSHTTPHTLHHTLTPQWEKAAITTNCNVDKSHTHNVEGKKQSPLGESNVGEVQIQENCVTGVRRRAAFGSWVLSGKGGRSP